MTTLRIWHNPRCRKSRETLSLLEQHGYKPEIVLYLDTPPNQAQLKKVVKLIGDDVRTIMRTKEAEYRTMDLANASAAACIKAMTEHPKLIERPIVIVGNFEKAAIGRPPEAVLEMLP